MRILITGSQGTIGRPLVEELRNRGHEVWGCDLMHAADPQYVRADVADSHQLHRVFSRSKPDAVYHLAAEFGRHNGELYTEQLWRTAMIGTRYVLELCDLFGARLFFASSSEVYGEHADEIELRENQLELLVPQLPNEYALSKYANEKQIEAFRGYSDIDVTVLRFFNAYGPGEPWHSFRSVVALFCDKALRGQRLPVFKGYHRTFMYVDDFIPTLANVCEAELQWRVYNIGGKDYRSVHELARIVVDEVAKAEAKAVWEMDQIELIPEDRHNTRSKRPEIWRAQQDLGHDPRVMLEEGVPLTLEWMRSRRHDLEPIQNEPA